MVDEVTPLPRHGEVFADAYDPARACRVSWHPTEHVFVLSIWHADRCVGTFRLARESVPALVQTLVGPLAGAGEAGAGIA
jgi:hypothetical protein